MSAKTDMLLAVISIYVLFKPVKGKNIKRDLASAIPEDLDKIKESGLSLIQHFSKIEEKVKYRLLFKKAYN